MSKTDSRQSAQAGTSSAQAPLLIGIGASAGGLEALQQFFGYMPPNSGLSFVVIQHISPDYKSLMADILASTRKWPSTRPKMGCPSSRIPFT